MAVQTTKPNPSLKKAQSAASKCPPRNSSAKQVLAPTQQPSEQWPVFQEEQVQQVKDALTECSSGMQQTTPDVKPPWSKLKNVDKKQRKEFCEKYKEEYLEGLPVKEKEEFLRGQVVREEKWSHMFQGYNKIMREIMKDEVAALLLNKSTMPEYLAQSFLPVCKIKNIPVVPLDNLDASFLKCIAIGFKNLIKSPECCFYPLYQKMLAVTCKEASSATGTIILVTETRCESDLPTCDNNKDSNPKADADSKRPIDGSNGKYEVCIKNNATINKYCRSRIKKRFPPAVDVSLYHLTRTRTDQRAFVPNQGYNRSAFLGDQELIMISNVTPGEAVGVAKKTFNYRQKPIYKGRKKFSFDRSDGKKNTDNDVNVGLVLEGSCVGDEVSEAVCRESSDMLFQFDFEGDDALPAVAESTSFEKKSEGDAHLDCQKAGKKDLQSKGDVSSTRQNVSKGSTILKRKLSVKPSLSDLTYIPATVTRIVANVKRKRHK